MKKALLFVPKEDNKQIFTQEGKAQQIHPMMDRSVVIWIK